MIEAYTFPLKWICDLMKTYVYRTHFFKLLINWIQIHIRQFPVQLRMTLIENSYDWNTKWHFPSIFFLYILMLLQSLQRYNRINVGEKKKQKCDTLLTFVIVISVPISWHLFFSEILLRRPLYFQIFYKILLINILTKTKNFFYQKFWLK